MSDEELALKAKNGDANAMNELLGKYKTMVGRLCRSYFLLGGDIEDLNQEGMIGLYKAIQGYNQNKNVKFKTFANVCIKHQLLSAIKIASSQKKTWCFQVQSQSQKKLTMKMKVFLKLFCLLHCHNLMTA